MGQNTPDSMDLPGYDVIRQIGSGGMASVYLAVQKSLHREVALKVLTPGLAVDESYCQRFLKEGRIAAQLSHVNVMTVYDIGVHDNYYYMAMEYLETGTVRQRMKQGLGEEQIVRIIADIARGLNYAHSKGFVHRDVKPGNMLFRDDDSCVLGDFGIAKAVDSNTGSTKLGTSIGTPHYMSPEQARGEKVDHRTDLYSLGVVFFELLSGALPFDAPDPFSVALMQISSPTPDLPERYAVYQPMVNRLMEKDRNLRYNVAAELIEDLAQNTDFLITGPITSPSHELLTELGKSTGRITARSGRTGGASNARSEMSFGTTAWLKLALAAAMVLLVVAAWVWWPDSESQNTIEPTALEPTQPPGDNIAARENSSSEQSRDNIDALRLPGNKPDSNAAPDEFSVLLQDAADRQQAGILITAEGSGAIGLYLKALQLNPDDRQAITGLREATDDLLHTIETLREIGDPDTAGDLLELATDSLRKDTRFMVLAARVRSDNEARSLVQEPSAEQQDRQPETAVAPPGPQVRPVDPEVQQVALLLEEGDSFYQAHKYGFPPGENATDRYLDVLDLAPDNKHAISQLTKIADSWADAAQSLLEKGKADRALGMVVLGLRARPSHPRLLDLKSRIEAGKAD